MAENLNYNKSGSWCGGGGEATTTEGDCSVYGRLYTWADAKEVCPAGWHLPSQGEFRTLVRIADKGFADDWDDAWNKSNAAGGKLKADSDLWADNGKGTDLYGFAGLPAGHRYYSDSKFYNVGVNAYFWSSTPYDASNAYRTALSKGNAIADLDNYKVGDGFSVRCLTNVCGTKAFDASKQFCYEEQLYDRCGTVEYDPTTQFCDTRDNQIYKMVTIGEQTWMAENLNYAASGSVCHSNNAANCNTYGRLYTWATAMSGTNCTNTTSCTPTYPVKGVCPTGWHLPSMDEFYTLLDNVSMSNWDAEHRTKPNAGKALKTTTGWNDGGNGTDTFGFSVKPAGYMDREGSAFATIGGNVFFWSSTQAAEENGYGMYLTCTDDDGHRYEGDKKFGFAVRCLKN